MTRKYRIKGLRKYSESSIADINNFIKEYEGELDFIEYWKKNKKCITPFCFDYKNKAVVFLETPEEVNLVSVHPFFYEAQRQYAIKLFLVPFSIVKSLIQEMKGIEDSKPLFLFSTGRCGSTVLCNLLGNNANTVSISEPDFFSQLPYIHKQYGTEIYPELVQLTRGLTLLLETYIGTFCNESVIVFKLRSMCIDSAELIAESMPEADHIFLYRNANDTVNSFLSVFSHHPILSIARALNTRFFPLLNHISIGFMAKLPGLKPNIEVSAPLIKESVYQKISIGTGTSIYALAWLSNLDKVLALQRAEKPFFRCLVRYDELKTNALAIMTDVMTSLGLGKVDELMQERMRQTLKKDSQAGSAMSSKGESILSVKDLGIIESVLSKHSEIRSAYYLLPNLVGKRFVDKS